jgi:hypothetical protein
MTIRCNVPLFLRTIFAYGLQGIQTPRNSNTSIDIEYLDGGRGRDRTGDPLLAKQVLSQLSYTPTMGIFFILMHLPN